MGMPPSDLKEVLGAKSEIPAPPLQVAVGIPADLLRRRPDIQSAEWRAAAQCAQIGVAKANLYPSFSLIGTFGLQATDVSNSPIRPWPSEEAVQVSDLTRTRDLGRGEAPVTALHDVISPVTEEVVASVPSLSLEETDAAIARAAARSRPGAT